MNHGLGLVSVYRGAPVNTAKCVWPNIVSKNVIQFELHFEDVLKLCSGL